MSQPWQAPRWWRRHGDILVAALFAVTIVAGIVTSLVPQQFAAYCRAVTVILAMLTMLAGILRLEEWVTGSRPNDVRWALLVVAWITICILVVASFGYFGSESEWMLPWRDLGKPEVIIAVLLGMATLLALVITMGAIKREQIPRAFALDEALEEATKFITTQTELGREVRLCSYYPNIGAATQSQYPHVYVGFKSALEKCRVKCVGLEVFNGEDPITPDGLRRLGEDVCGRRPKNVQEAIAAFATMWDPVNDQDLTEACNMFRHALIDVNGLLLSDLGEAYRKITFRAAEYVPDFHFLLATTPGSEIPRKGFLLVPLMPAGMHPPARNEDIPPMLGVVVVDRVILRHLLLLWQRLPEKVRGSSEGAPGTA